MTTNTMNDWICLSPAWEAVSLAVTIIGIVILAITEPPTSEPVEWFGLVLTLGGLTAFGVPHTIHEWLNPTDYDDETE